MTLSDAQPARPVRSHRWAILLVVLLPLSASWAGDDRWLMPPDSDPLLDRGWLVEPGFSTGQDPGLYREIWPSTLSASQADADQYTGIRHRFHNGLGLDTGVVQYGFVPEPSRYQEYYFGLSYDVWQGRAWYTDDYQGSGMGRAYYEFGVSGDLGNDLSLSARLGYGDNRFGFDHEQHPAYVFSARKRDLYGFGLNLQLMGSTDPRRSESEDLRVMGVLSRPLP
jgi:uncharacterized protein (TIGR02001 family)